MNAPPPAPPQEEEKKRNKPAQGEGHLMRGDPEAPGPPKGGQVSFGQVNRFTSRRGEPLGDSRGGRGVDRDYSECPSPPLDVVAGYRLMRVKLGKISQEEIDRYSKSSYAGKNR